MPPPRPTNRTGRRLAAAACGLAALAGCGPGPASAADPAPAAALPSRETVEPPAEPTSAPDRPWLDVSGTSIVGFGVLRVVPPAGGGTFRIRYRETPDAYARTDALQLFVLPGDAFAERHAVYAGDFLAFARTPPYGAGAAPASLALEVDVRAERERVLLVAYGPWTAPDTGRPPGDVPTFEVRVEPPAGGAFEWIESEAGELITTNWTGRPEVERGTPAPDPVGGRPLHIEVRPLILYDARLVREPDEAPVEAVAGGPSPAELRSRAAELAELGSDVAARDLRERAEDLEAHLRRADRRIVMAPELAEKFRRVPIRWR